MKKLLIILLAFSLVLTFSGCSGRKLDVSSADSLNGVTAQIMSCTAKTEKNGLNDQYPCTYFDIEISITNNSTDEIMKVCYNLDVLDKAGNVLYEFPSMGYIMKTGPLSEGQSTTFTAQPQRVLDGKAASVRLTLTDTVTAEELPPVHVPETGESLADAKDSEHLKNMDNDPPVMIEICIDHGGDAKTAELTDGNDISEFISLFSKVRIAEQTDEVVTDNYNRIVFTFSDGETVSISLNLKNLEISANGAEYIFTLSDFDGLWNYMNDAVQ